PITLATPIFAGGLVRGGISKYVERKDDDEGTLEEHTTYRGRIIAAGLIAGEAIMGIVIGGLYILEIGQASGAPFRVGLAGGTQTTLGVIAIVLLVAFFTGAVLRNAPDV
ncbi:MAG: hypothetical protein ACI9YT_002751, partial [Halobacteriales archaeon]